MDANAIYSYYGRDKLGFNSKPVDEKALRCFLLGKELSLPTSVLIEVITHFREDVDKLYDLLQFIRELGLPIYNNMPDYSCILIDEIIACAVAYKKSENDFIEVIQNTYNDSINAGLNGNNGTMKCIVDVLAHKIGEWQNESTFKLLKRV